MVFRNETIFLLSLPLCTPKHHLYIQQILALLKRKQKAYKRQEVLTTLWTELSPQKNTQTGELYWRHHSLMDEIYSISMIVFSLNRLNLAIVHNYCSIYCCEHCAKNGLIFAFWINSTWCSPSHSHLMVGHYSYNAIDNIEQYWWQGKAG